MALKADIRAMLRKFGVVTVMDVKAYEAVRYDADGESTEERNYSKGEWDCINTFTYKEATVEESTSMEQDTTSYILNRAVKEGQAVTCNNSSITGITVDTTNKKKITFSNGLTATTTVKFTYTASACDKDPLFQLDSLKIANINSEGPTKEIKGGQNADTLLKYGKTFTVEMQDGLGRYDVLDAIYGVNFSTNHQFATVSDRFPAELTIVGSTFVIDQKTGAKQPVKVVLPIFLGDGIFNLTQDAEGDATVFDMNGSLLRFNGIDAGQETEDCGETRFDDSSSHSAFDGYIYKKGTDNEFYFLCTAEGLDLLKTLDYVDAKENIPE